MINNNNKIINSLKEFGYEILIGSGSATLLKSNAHYLEFFFDEGDNLKEELLKEIECHIQKIEENDEEYYYDCDAIFLRGEWKDALLRVVALLNNKVIFKKVILENEDLPQQAYALDFLKKSALIDTRYEDYEWKTYKQVFDKVEIADLSDEIIYEEFSIVEFDFIVDLNTTIKLKGVFVWNDIEGNYEIDFDESFSPYVCLTYNSALMSNFKVIGNVFENKNLLTKL